MDGQLAGAVAVLLALGGAALVYSGRPGRPPRRSHHSLRGDSGADLRRLLTGGLPIGVAGQVPVRQLGLAMVAATIGGGTFAYLLFGGIAPVIFGALFAGTFPVAAYRRRCRVRRDADAEAWPRLVEEIRLRTGSLGRSIPQALFEAGRHAPENWRPAFAAAEREWLLTTDFPRTVARLKDALASPPGDIVLETLLMAYDVGGVDLESWLGELAEDRMVDLDARRDAVSKQAGVRFARIFVLLVPLGMTLAGLSIGSGRAAYETAGGQVAVVVGIVATIACWVWAGRLMVLPEPPRVFGTVGVAGRAGAAPAFPSTAARTPPPTSASGGKGTAR